MWAKNRVSKTWQAKDDPIKTVLNTDRGHSITLYGAVANFTSEIIMMVEKKTEMHAFREFLQLLKKHKDENYIKGPIYLVLDNHTAHYAKKIRGAYAGFKTLFLPAYSS